MAEVERQFLQFIEAAQRLGVDTEGWALHRGNSSYKVQWVVSTPPQRRRLKLGYTASDAYRGLGLVIDALELVGRTVAPPQH